MRHLKWEIETTVAGNETRIGLTEWAVGKAGAEVITVSRRSGGGLAASPAGTFMRPTQGP